jgi:hypothetical protein
MANIPVMLGKPGESGNKICSPLFTVGYRIHADFASKGEGQKRRASLVFKSC